MTYLLTLLIAALCSLAATAQPQPHLDEHLDSLRLKLLPKGSQVALAVYDLTADSLLYVWQPEQLSRPASTMKLLTAITALSLPEADEPFTTEVWRQGELRGDTLVGSLYVVGGMDPEFDDEAMDSLVDGVVRSGIRVIKGHVCGDVSLRDSLYWGSGWLWDDNPSAFQPYLSPLMLCKGVLTVQLTPAATRGDTAQLICHPASTYYNICNQTQSRTPAAGRFSLTRNWLEGGNRVTVCGNVTTPCTASINLAASERFFMHTFAERLRARGVRCLATSDTVAYRFEEFKQDSTAQLLARHFTPMQTVLNQLMKESDNLNAEAMLCRIGAQTTGHRHLSAGDGLDAMRRMIRRLGYNPADYRLADGSGLSNYNYISPELLVAFLRHAYADTELFRKLYKSLPVGGVDGTLKYRMRRGTPSYGQVHAKTGSYTAINCLAGYVQTHGGHWLAFAIMNQNVLSGRQARAYQDAVTDALVGLHSR